MLESVGKPYFTNVEQVSLLELTTNNFDELLSNTEYPDSVEFMSNFEVSKYLSESILRRLVQGLQEYLSKYQFAEIIKSKSTYIICKKYMSKALELYIPPEPSCDKTLEFAPSTSVIESNTELLTSEQIDECCLLGKLNFTDLFNTCMSNKIAISSKTGTGKTLRLCQGIVSLGVSSTIIVLTHSNSSANFIYRQVISLGYPEDKIVCFNSDEDNYKLYKKDPSKFSDYRCVICYCDRLFKGDVDIIYKKISRIEDLENGSIYVFSDECISRAFAVHIKRSVVNSLETIFDEVLVSSSHDSEKLRGIKTFFTTGDCGENDINYRMAMKLKKIFSDKINCGEYLDSSPDIQILSAKIPASFIKRLLIKSNNIEFKNDKITKYELMRSINILGKFIDDIKNHPSKYVSWYRGSSFSSLDDYRSNNYGFFVGIDQLDPRIKFLVFDATAKINYGGSSEFELIDPLNIPDHLVNFRRINLDTPINRHCDISNYNNFFNDLYADRIHFNNDSVVVWFNDAQDKSDLRDRFQKYINTKRSSDNIYFISFNGGEVKGSNKYRTCKNIYILDYYFIARAHVYEHRFASGNQEYDVDDKFLADCEQVIGRTNYRDNLRKVLSNIDFEKTTVYLSTRIPDTALNKLISIYGTWEDYEVTDEQSLKFKISKLCKDSNGKRLRSSSEEKLLMIYNYVVATKKESYTIKELCELVKVSVKLDRIQVFLDNLSLLGVKVNVCGKYKGQILN